MSELAAPGMSDADMSWIRATMEADSELLGALAARPAPVAPSDRVLTAAYRQGRYTFGLGRPQAQPTGRGLLGAASPAAVVDERDARARNGRRPPQGCRDLSKLLPHVLALAVPAARSAATACGNASLAAALPRPSHPALRGPLPAELEKAFLQDLRSRVVRRMAADAELMEAVEEGSLAESVAATAIVTHSPAEPGCAPIHLPRLAAAIEQAAAGASAGAAPAAPVASDAALPQPAWVTAALRADPAALLGDP